MLDDSYRLTHLTDEKELEHATNYGRSEIPNASAIVPEKGPREESTSSPTMVSGLDSNRNILQPLLQTGKDLRSNRTVQFPAARTIDEFYETAYHAKDGNRLCGGETFFNNLQWRYLVIVMALGFANVGDAAELLCIGYVLSDQNFQDEILNDDFKGKGALVTSMSNIGLIASTLLVIDLENRIGRKPLVLLGLGLNTVAGVIAAISSSSEMFVFGRFLTGIGMGFILSYQPALATECAPAKERGGVVTLANGFWTLGLIFTAVVAYIIFGVFNGSWRTFMLAATLPSAIGFGMTYYYIPESARFHAIQGNYEAAAKSANAIATSMGYDGHPIEESDIRQHYMRLENDLNCSYNHDKRLFSQKEKVILGDVPHSVVRWVLRFVETMKEMFSPNLWDQTISIQIFLVLISIGSSLAYWINTIFKDLHIANVYVSFLILNCSCIPGNIASNLLVDRVGRKPFLAFSLAGSSIALFVFAYYASIVSSSGDRNSSNVGHSFAILVAACGYYAWLTAVWMALNVMSAETFPTNIRAAGMALSSAGGRVASIAAQYINGALIDRPATLVFIGAVVLGMASIFTFLSPLRDMAQKEVVDTSNESKSARTTKVLVEHTTVLDSHELPLAERISGTTTTYCSIP